MVIDEHVMRRDIADPISASLLHIIINPAAGNGRAGRRWPEFEAAMARHGYDIRPQFTSGPGDASRIARQLAQDQVRTIVCIGGDGTVNEVVNGMIVDDQPISDVTRLALIPCGTGKDLCRTLGTNDAEAMLKALADGSTARIDIGKVTYQDTMTRAPVTHYFANVADTGIGAQTAARINASSKALGGFVSYLTGAVRSIAAYKPWDITVEVDGEQVHNGSAGMVVFANGRYFAGGMRVAPDASLCDGRLDIFVLKGVGKRTLLTSLLPRVYRGKHVGRPGVTYLTGTHATVTCTGEMLVEMDGEQVGLTPISVTIVPRALYVVGSLDALTEAGGCTERVE